MPDRQHLFIIWHIIARQVHSSFIRSLSNHQNILYRLDTSQEDKIITHLPNLGQRTKRSPTIWHFSGYSRWEPQRWEDSVVGISLPGLPHLACQTCIKSHENFLDNTPNISLEVHLQRSGEELYISRYLCHEGIAVSICCVIVTARFDFPVLLLYHPIHTACIRRTLLISMWATDLKARIPYQDNPFSRSLKTIP